MYNKYKNQKPTIVPHSKTNQLCTYLNTKKVSDQYKFQLRLNVLFTTIQKYNYRKSHLSAIIIIIINLCKQQSKVHSGTCFLTKKRLHSLTGYQDEKS